MTYIFWHERRSLKLVIGKLLISDVLSYKSIKLSLFRHSREVGK